MSTLRSAIWRIAQSTTECDCAICTSCTGSGQIASPGSPAAGRQPGSRTPARQRDASPAAGRQPSSSQTARQQPASPAATRQPAAASQPSSSQTARQQPASPAAARQPGSNQPAQQQPDSPAAARQPGSSQTARQQDASPAATRQPGSYVIYAPARAGAPAPRRSNVPARACVGAQVLRARPRTMRVRECESWVGL